MKLPKRVTCKGCGHRVRIRWEIRQIDFAAGLSNCYECRYSRFHFVGSEQTISEILEVAKQEVSLFEPGAIIQKIRDY